MSGADLANLVNEAALHAVRRGSQVIQNEDFEASRDRVLMGQRRESLVLSNAEKERVAFHEGGHAVLAYVLPDADPVHKVTILPTGMALGVTMQLPMEERHIHPRQHIEDSLAVRMGGRAAELLVYGDLSTGASNDLVGNTELARKMVREWGMSDKIGPMAWGSQGQVFLGEDLMHTRDYSEHTSQVIDDEVEQILRAQEQRALEVLARHRGGLDAVARALLDEETIDGETVGRLVDTAYGRPVHAPGVKSVPPIFVASQHGPSGSENVDGPPADVPEWHRTRPAVPGALGLRTRAAPDEAPAGEPAGSVSNAADAPQGEAPAPGPGTGPGTRATAPSRRPATGRLPRPGRAPSPRGRRRLRLRLRAEPVVRAPRRAGRGSANPDEEAIPGAPVGASSASTVTGPEDVTTSGRRPPTCAGPNTVTPPAPTRARATAAPPPSGVTVTSTGEPPGSATARLWIEAPDTDGLPGAPGATTSQVVAVAVDPIAMPAWGEAPPAGATTVRPTTTGAVAVTVSA